MRRPQRGGPRRGVVLGAGGPLGAAWTVGALSAIEEVLSIDLRTVEYIAAALSAPATAA